MERNNQQALVATETFDDYLSADTFALKEGIESYDLLDDDDGRVIIAIFNEYGEFARYH